jgi:oxygen-independent coproporphyrinogen-3 oxidase
MKAQTLIKKYNVPVPRYTSYPTVPFWDENAFRVDKWKEFVQDAFLQSNKESGISLYIHLPFCESLCTYCACNTRITKNHAVEDPYILAVEKEWMMYEELFEEKAIIKELHLGGGTPTFFSPENLKSLIQNILSGCEIHPKAEFSFEAHPANTTHAHLTTLFKLGFKRLSLGIQDFDPKVQQIINREQSFEDVKTVTDDARKMGYTSINYDLIYGLPLQTLAGLSDTLDKVKLLHPDRIAFYNYAHVPWIKPGQRMFTELDLPNYELKQELYELGRKRLVEFGYIEIGMDHFALKRDSLNKAYKKNKLHRNFMGYTHNYTQLMIGLGVSSISDTWFAFAQNAKKVEEYYEMINNGEFPVVKGHLLTKDDLLMRKHILNIMCTGKTSWDRLDLMSHDFKKSLYRLHDLEIDGLIIRHENSIAVTKIGERFLRNICAAFDARLHYAKASEQLFSMA